MGKTYGERLVEHDNLQLELEDDIIEYRKKMEEDVVRNIQATVSKAINTPLYKGQDFYVVLIPKIEKLGGIPRTLVFARKSCPTPVYNQSVWKYHVNSGALEFLWSIPDSILYYHILNNSAQYLADSECNALAKFVLLMESGELLQWVKKENGEKKDVIIRIHKEDTCQTN